MLKRNLAANYLGQGWVALMGLAFVPLYIKYLGIEAYGVIGFFVLLQAALSLMDLGMAPTLNREMARSLAGRYESDAIRDLLRSVEFVTVALALVVFGCVSLAADWLATSWLKANTLPPSVLVQAVTIMGGVIGIRLLEGVYRSSLVGLQRQVEFNVVNSVMATLRSAGAVGVLAWIAPTVQAFFFWQGAVSLITLAWLAFATYSALPPATRRAKFSVMALRNVCQFAGGVMAVASLSLLLTQIDKVLLSTLLTLPEYGYYTLAAAVTGAVLMLVSPILQAMFPRMSQLHAAGNHAELVKTYHLGAQLVSVVLSGTALVMVFFGDLIIEIWTQDSELADRVAPVLSVLAFGNLLNGLMRMPYQAQLVYGWTGLAMRINLVSACLLVPAILWVTPMYGMEGAAWVWVGLNAGYVLIGVHFMYAKIMETEKWKWYVQDAIRPVLAAAVAIGGVRWVVEKQDRSLDGIGLIALAVLAGTLAAALSASLLRKEIGRLLGRSM